jgi:flagellar assembly factor FliW
MQIETTRFGTVTVEDNDVITFPEGMLGFSKIHEYVLIERTDDSLFVWLQALKKPSVAFPLLEPQIFEMNYRIDMEEADRKLLKLDKLKFAKVFSIVTIPSDPTKMTANLKAPIVINLKKRLAHQVILHMQDYPIRKAIYAELQKHCAASHRSVFPVGDAEPAYQTIHITEQLATPGVEVSR